MNKLIAFLEKDVEIDGHSIFDPYKLGENDNFSEEQAKAYLEIALEVRTEEHEISGKYLTACRLEKKFREDEKFRKEAINEFIILAKRAAELGEE